MPLVTGEPAPRFRTRSTSTENLSFGNAGGRWNLVGFFPSSDPGSHQAMELLKAHRHLFRDGAMAAFGILDDVELFDGQKTDGGLSWLLDEAAAIAAMFRQTTPGGATIGGWIVIDPQMRVMGAAPLVDGPQVMLNIQRLPRPDDHAGVPVHAPVLIVPRVFTRSLCNDLVAYYKLVGGLPSGGMVERDGKTVEVLTDAKRRSDVYIQDEKLRSRVVASLRDKLFPEIERAFQFKVTRMERYLVACYDANSGGYFRRHRDNTTPGTAHRKFACTINLNAEHFEGGELRFPEFGSRTYRAPTGGAVIFSCSLLHEAMEVRKGERYAFLPFLYDEAGAAIRQQNLADVEVRSADERIAFGQANAQA